MILKIENTFLYIWSYFIFNFTDLCNKDLQAFVVDCYRIAWIKKFKKAQITLLN